MKHPDYPLIAKKLAVHHRKLSNQMSRECFFAITRARYPGLLDGLDDIDALHLWLYGISGRMKRGAAGRRQLDVGRQALDML